MLRLQVGLWSLRWFQLEVCGGLPVLCCVFNVLTLGYAGAAVGGEGGVPVFPPLPPPPSGGKRCCKCVPGDSLLTTASVGDAGGAVDLFPVDPPLPPQDESKRCCRFCQD